ncbi:MAG: hypothetical protein N2748_01635 [candidate division WOR-3 bacterium]|nr:hypothetical protein [candidate division WOR-3 bacterium]
MLKRLFFFVEFKLFPYKNQITIVAFNFEIASLLLAKAKRGILNQVQNDKYCFRLCASGVAREDGQSESTISFLS